jgi:hypothetical protein
MMKRTVKERWTKDKIDAAEVNQADIRAIQVDESTGQWGNGKG